MNIGIESTDPDVIHNVKRGWIDPNHISKMVQYMAKNGVRISGFSIIGLPGETLKSCKGKGQSLPTIESLRGGTSRFSFLLQNVG